MLLDGYDQVDPGWPGALRRECLAHLDALVEAVNALDALVRLDRGLEYISAHEETGNAELIVTLDAFERCVHALAKLGGNE